MLVFESEEQTFTSNSLGSVSIRDVDLGDNSSRVRTTIRSYLAYDRIRYALDILRRFLLSLHFLCEDSQRTTRIENCSVTRHSERLNWSTENLFYHLQKPVAVDSPSFSHWNPSQNEFRCTSKFWHRWSCCYTLNKTQQCQISSIMWTVPSIIHDTATVHDSSFHTNQRHDSWFRLWFFDHMRVVLVICAKCIILVEYWCMRLWTGFDLVDSHPTSVSCIVLWDEWALKVHCQKRNQDD